MTSALTSAEECWFGAFMWYGQYLGDTISILARTYQVFPTVSYREATAKLYAVTNIDANDYCYEVNKLGTIVKESNLSISADSIEIYLCK